MTLPQFNAISILVLLVTFSVGVAFAKKGGNALPDAKKPELDALGPDALGMIGIAGAVTLGYLVSWLHVWAVVGAVACGTLSFIRIPLRLYRQSWPQRSRYLLLTGNAILIAGAMLFSIIRVIPYGML